MGRTKAIGYAVLVVCVGGIAGMIITSATNHNGAAITFGLITAVAILCQMTATTVANELRRAPRAPTVGTGADEEAAAVEAGVTDLVEHGAEEAAVRDLVRRAVRLGRQTPAGR
jgi:hypothetical protein